MAKPFYRGTDAQLSSGAALAISIITPSPATYGVTTGIVTSYTTLSTNYTNLLGIATARATRSPVAIENKNSAKKLLMAATINLVRTITATPTVTNAQLMALGMNPRVVPQPRPVPPGAPVVEVDSVNGRVANIRVHAAGSDKRGKPFGAVAANIFSYVGPTPPTDVTLYQFQGQTTRSKTEILFPNSVASGATIWLSASWVSARGEMSMGSVPISFTLQGGAIPAAA